MSLISTLKQKAENSRNQEITQQAEYIIRITDFEGKLYVAYDGTPLIPIDDSWTQKEILNELNMVRSNYIRSRFKRNNIMENDQERSI